MYNIKEQFEQLTPRAQKFISLYDRQSKESEQANYYTRYPNVNYIKAERFENKAAKTQEMLDRMVTKMTEQEKENIEIYITVPIFEDWN